MKIIELLASQEMTIVDGKDVVIVVNNINGVNGFVVAKKLSNHPLKYSRSYLYTGFDEDEAVRIFKDNDTGGLK